MMVVVTKLIRYDIIMMQRSLEQSEKDKSLLLDSI